MYNEYAVFTRVHILSANDLSDSFVCFCSCCNIIFACCFDFSESNISENSLQNVSQSNFVSLGSVEYHFCAGPCSVCNIEAALFTFH